MSISCLFHVYFMVFGWVHVYFMASCFFVVMGDPLILTSVRPRSILAEPNRTEIFSAAIWPNRDLPRFSRRQYGRTEIYRDCEICCRTEPNRDCRELLTKGTGSVPVSTNAKIAFVAICSPTYRRLIVTGGRILLRRISLLVSQAN